MSEEKIITLETVQAFKTSDGSLFETEKAAINHVNEMEYLKRLDEFFSDDKLSGFDKYGLMDFIKQYKVQLKEIFDIL